MTHPLDPIKKLSEQLRAAADALGLDMQSVAILPDMTGDSHMLQAVFVLGDIPVEVSPEQAETDEAFAEIERQMKRDEEAETIAQAGRRAQELRDRLAGGGGFLE